MSHLHRAETSYSGEPKGHRILRVQLPIDLHLYTKVLTFHRTEKETYIYFKFSRIYGTLCVCVCMRA